MATTTGDSNEVPTVPSGKFSDYFKKLSENYARRTGNSTYDLFTKFLPELQPPINSASTVHDNACGVGTASIAILSNINNVEMAPKIEATDFVPAMIDSLSARAAEHDWSNLTATVMDSHELQFPDEHFTHSICNINLFTFEDPLQSLRELYRTLKPGGVAVVSCWKRFAVVEMIWTAQRAINPETPLMPLPKPEFLQQGYLRNMVVEAGFNESNCGELGESVLITGEYADGLRGFMLDDFTASARAGWSEDQQARWPHAIDAAMGEEVAKHGGFKMEAWFVVARK